MDESNIIAKAQTVIDAPIGALVTPEIIKKYMFGTDVVSEWREGSRITWSGEWKGKAYEDKGEILQIIPHARLKYSHFSPLTGEEDSPENYHIVTIDLTTKNNKTEVSLSQDNNKTEEERGHSEKNWNQMLESLKKLLEEDNG